MRAAPGRPWEIASSRGGSTSDFGHRHPVQHAILSENQASPPACRLLLWQLEELLQVREIVVRASTVYKPRVTTQFLRKEHLLLVDTSAWVFSPFPGNHCQDGKDPIRVFDAMVHVRVKDTFRNVTPFPEFLENAPVNNRVDAVSNQSRAYSVGPSFVFLSLMRVRNKHASETNVIDDLDPTATQHASRAHLPAKALCFGDWLTARLN